MSKIIKKIFNFLYKEESLKIIWSSWWIYFYSLILTGLIVLSMKINHKIVVTSLAGISITYITVLLLYMHIYKPKKLRYKRWLNVFCMRLFADKETKKSKKISFSKCHPSRHVINYLTLLVYCRCGQSYVTYSVCNSSVQTGLVSANF